MRWYRVLALLLICFHSLGLAGVAGAAESEKPAKRNKYQRSKLTNDESESIADKRRLLLTTGEDKAVDLDFDANGGANGISYGNPQILMTTLVTAGDKRQIV